MFKKILNVKSNFNLTLNTKTDNKDSQTQTNFLRYM